MKSSSGAVMHIFLPYLCNIMCQQGVATLQLTEVTTKINVCKKNFAVEKLIIEHFPWRFNSFIVIVLELQSNYIFTPKFIANSFRRAKLPMQQCMIDQRK